MSEKFDFGKFFSGNISQPLQFTKELLQAALVKEFNKEQLFQNMDFNSDFFNETKRKTHKITDSIRQRALSYIIKQNIEEELSRDLKNPDNFTLTLLSYLQKNPKSLEQQSLDELYTTFKVARTLPSELNPPSLNNIQNEINKKEYLIPLQRLTANFQGRSREMGRLKGYVDWLPKESFRESIEASFRSLFSWHEKAPLLIKGIGGIGKSTLIAKFILDHIENDPNSKNRTKNLPFVFIDFDIPGFSLSEPMNIVTEGLRQLSIQFPEKSSIFRKAIEQITSNLGGGATSSGDRENIYNQVGGLLTQYQSRLSNINQPILVVFDSFEELQFRANRTELSNFFRTVREISERITRIRPVFVGRAEITLEEDPNLQFETIKLESFDKESSNGYLASLGISENTLRQQIFNKFGGNPLTLQLAANVILHEHLSDIKAISGVKTHFLFRRLEDRNIQQVLVQRNLDHIHDNEVRKIAVPGLLMRQISPEIIKEILAIPCGLGEVSLEKAQEIFKNLIKETFLIQKEVTETEVTFRQDLRITMEDMIWKLYPDASEQIHRNAITYFESVHYDLAESVYHKIKLEEDLEFLTEELLFETREFLENSYGEFSIRVQMHIGRILGSRIAINILEDARLEDWEGYYAKIIKDAMKGELYDLQDIRREIDQRGERSFNSSLYYNQAVLLQRLGSQDRSLVICWRALDDTIEYLREADSNDFIRIRRLRFQLLAVENYEYLNEYENALKLLNEIPVFDIIESQDPFIAFSYILEHVRINSRLGYQFDIEPLMSLKELLDNELINRSYFYDRKLYVSLLKDYKVGIFRVLCGAPYVSQQGFSSRVQAFLKEKTEIPRLAKSFDVKLDELIDLGVDVISYYDALQAIEIYAGLLPPESISKDDQLLV